MSFTLPGNQTLNPTYLSYAAYTITSNLELQWPFQAADDDDVCAAKLGISAAASLTVTLPDATLASVGQDVLITNLGSNTFTVKSNQGTTIGSVASGESWYFWLRATATADGTWSAAQFATGTSSATAASLAGAGLSASTTLLNQNLTTTSLAADYTIQNSDRAFVMRNTGGAVTWTFATTGSASGQLANGWFAYFINSGSGNITLTAFAGQTIDAAATKTLTPTESCVVFSDGSNLWSLGFGQSISTTTTGSSFSVAGSGDAVLTANQVAAQVQTFTGALTGNKTATYGTGVGYWFVYNNTSGAYTLTARVNSGDAGAAITQGNYSILRSDGTNMKVAFTATSGTVTSIATTSGQLTGGTITTTGTLGLATTAVTPGTYGSASTSAQIVVDAYGRLTSASSIALAITVADIAIFTSAAFYARVSDPTGSGGAIVFATGPTLTNPVVGTQVAGNNTTLAASTAFVTTAVAAVINQSTTAPTTQTFTVAGAATYTTPAGVKWIKVRMVGAGGGGGGTGQTLAPTGGNGTNTIFNSVNASAGTGGAGSTGVSDQPAVGVGGTAGAGTATLRMSGANASYISFVTTSVTEGGSSGGQSVFGGAGQAYSALANQGGGASAKANSGSGGAGINSGGLTAPSAGGGAGEYVELIISSPAASYAYTVGTKGAGGIGTGTGAFTGGAGGDGYITVEEHYNF